MTDEITIQRLFQFQDEAMQYIQNSTIVRKRLAFISEAVSLSWPVLVSMQFTEHKQTAIRVFGSDAASSIVTGTRVALWGNLPDSLAFLRIALETAAILAAIVEERKYKTANYEVETRIGKFERMAFEDVVK